MSGKRYIHCSTTRIRPRKRKTIWAYLNGEKLVDVVEAALDNNMMVDELKKKLVEENPRRIVTFKYEEA